MKRWTMLFTLLAFTGLVAGCTLTGDEEDNTSVSTYLSLSTGQTWTYAVTGTSGSYTKTRTTTGTVERNGLTYWALTDSRSDSGDPETIYLRISGETVYTIKDSSGAEAPFFKFGIDAGTSWTLGSGASMTYDGLYDVTVTAGNYEDCARFTLTETGTGYTYTEIIWFAPNVGPVRHSWTETSTNGTSSSIAELTSYSSGTGGGDDGGDTTISLTDYLPIATGVKWVYTNNASSDTRSRTITGTKEYNGHTYFLVREVSSHGSDSSGIRTDGQIMYMIQDGVEAPYFKFGIAPGTSWTFTINSEVTTATYVGLETIGTRANCAKFTHTSGTNTDTEWVAPGIGPVQFSHTDEGGTETYVMTSFSTTAGTAEDNTTLNDYIRFSTGEYWIYSVSVASQGGNASFTKTRSVTGTAVKDSKTYYVIVETGGTNGTDSSGARIDGETMYVLMRDMEVQTINDGIGSHSDTTYTYTEVPFFKFGLPAGTQWNDGERTATYCGFEDVTAGVVTYTNCMKFTYTYTYTHIDESSQTHTYTNTETTWLAPGIGPVQETTTMTSNSTVMYSQTAIISSYSIPQ